MSRWPNIMNAPLHRLCFKSILRIWYDYLQLYDVLIDTIYACVVIHFDIIEYYNLAYGCMALLQS
jgi:hypothetical protein